MVITSKTYTADEFFEIARATENQDRRLELDNGVIVEMPPSRPINTATAFRIGRLVGNYVDEHNLGYVVGADSGFKLTETQVRQPDAAFVSRERYTSLPDEFEGGPDIAIEVISPREDALNKATEYLDAGTTLVWAIYPEQRKVHVLRKSDPRWTILEAGDVLTGEDVLPGFEVAVDDIFPE
jgi:Uma2 family endonuclease